MADADDAWGQATVFRSLHGPWWSLCSKLVLLALLLLQFVDRASTLRLHANLGTFNERLQSALNSVLWPTSAVCKIILVAALFNRVIAGSLWSIAPLVLPAVAITSQASPDDLQAGEWDIKHVTPVPLEDLDVDTGALHTARVVYTFARLCAPLAPILLGYSLFRPRERAVEVQGSEWNLPKGIYRSFMAIMALESVLNLALLPQQQWVYVHSTATHLLLLRHRWNWRLLLVLVVKGAAAGWETYTLHPLPTLVAAAAMLLLAWTIHRACRVSALVRLYVAAAEHTLLALLALLAIHRLSYVALARLAAIQAHQYAHALKKVTQSVLNEYRYARQPVRTALRKRTAHIGAGSPPLNGHVSTVTFAAAELPSSMQRQLSAGMRASKSMSELASAPMRPTPAPFTIDSDEEEEEGDASLNAAAQTRTNGVDELLLLPGRDRGGSIDVSKSIALIAAGVVPATPQERLEQYNLATAGQKRLLKTALLVWTTLITHAAVTLLADLYVGNGILGLTSSVPDAPCTDAASDTCDAGNASLPMAGLLSALVGHLVHLLHLGYMQWFVQYKMQGAEQGLRSQRLRVLTPALSSVPHAGLLDAWTRVRLLHTRLSSTTISKEEATDWCEFLRSRFQASTSTWPAMLLSLLGFLRFVLPALLAMTPTGSVQENAMHALRSFAVGGKYLIYQAKAAN